MNVNITANGDKIPGLCGKKGGILTYQGGILTVYAGISLQDLPHRPKWEKNVNGEIQLGLYTCEDVMVLSVKIGDLPWLAVPYNPHWDDPDDFPPYQSLNDGESLPVHIILARSEGGSIMGMRLFAPSTAFTREMLNRSRELLQKPYCKEEVTAHAIQICSQYTPYELYHEKAQVKYVLPGKR